jgi:N6-adenosine-specific RNA methylase IME4
MRYRTIVADPPWRYGSFNSFSSTSAKDTRPRLGSGKLTDGVRALAYETMTTEQIAALPVAAVADDEAHLYLWTTQRYLWDAPAVAQAWGFKPSMGKGTGFAFTPSTEFVLFAQRGGLKPLERHDSTWFEAGRPHGRGRGHGIIHSAKPDAFYDLVERVSPGPYLEMFARRARLGDWHYWGDESLGTAEVAA